MRIIEAGFFAGIVVGGLWLNGCKSSGGDNGNANGGTSASASGGSSAAGSSAGGATGASGSTAKMASGGSSGQSAGSTGSSGRAAGNAGNAGASTAGSSGSSAGAGGTAAAGAGAGGGSGSAGTSGASGNSGGAMTLTSTSMGVMAGAKLPKKYRCVALNGMSGPSPQLMWSGGPTAMSYAVTLSDLTNVIAHWTLYDIPPATMMLPEGIPLGAMPTVPPGAKQSPNQLTAMTGPGYFGPCGGATANMYEYEVYALDVASLPGLSASSTYAQVRTAIMMHTLPMGTAKLGVTSSSTDP